MEEKKFVPKLRFSGFDDNLKSCRLSDICEVKGRIGFRGYTKSDLVGKNEGALTLGGKHIDSNDKLNLDDPEYLSWEKYEESPEIKVNVGDIILAQRGTLGQSALIDKDIGKATINPSMVLLKDFKINNIFLHYLLTTPKLKKEVIRKSSSTAVPMISQAEIKKLRINYPSVPEQEKIGNLFKLIDKKTELLENKYQKYIDFKKYLMQQIFAQKLRFAEFKDEWKPYKIGEISKTYSGGTPSTSKRKYYEGDIPFIKSGEINNEITEQYINEDAIKNSSAKKVKKGDLLLALYGATSGEVAISKIDGAINQAVLKIDNDMDNYFQYCYFTLYKDQIVHKYIQGGQGNLSANIIKKLEFDYPTLTEQKKISQFLMLIEKQIKLLEAMLQKYHDFKKGLLQQMFV